MGRLFRAIKAGAFTLPTHLSLPARDLLKRMLTVDPLHRITIEEIRWASVSKRQTCTPA
jgi:serine/threonine protein kinase